MPALFEPTSDNWICLTALPSSSTKVSSMSWRSAGSAKSGVFSFRFLPLLRVEGAIRNFSCAFFLTIASSSAGFAQRKLILGAEPNDFRDAHWFLVSKACCNFCNPIFLRACSARSSVRSWGTPFSSRISLSRHTTSFSSAERSGPKPVKDPDWSILPINCKCKGNSSLPRFWSWPKTCARCINAMVPHVNLCTCSNRCRMCTWRVRIANFTWMTLAILTAVSRPNLSRLSHNSTWRMEPWTVEWTKIQWWS